MLTWSFCFPARSVSCFILSLTSVISPPVSAIPFFNNWMSLVILFALSGLSTLFCKSLTVKFKWAIWKRKRRSKILFLKSYSVSAYSDLGPHIIEPVNTSFTVVDSTKLLPSHNGWGHCNVLLIALCRSLIAHHSFPNHLELNQNLSVFKRPLKQGWHWVDINIHVPYKLQGTSLKQCILVVLKCVFLPA